MPDLEKKQSSCFLLSLVPLFLAAVLLAARWLPSIGHPVWNPDEIIESLAASDMLEGKVIYKDTVTHRAPLQHFIFLFLFRLSGPMNMTAVHAVLFLVLIQTLALLYAAGRAVSSAPAGGWAALLFVCMLSALRHYDSLAFHTEYLLVFFSSAAAFLIFRGVRRESRLSFFAAGTSLGLCFFSKQPGLMEMIGMTVPLAAAGMGRTGRPFFRAAVLWLLTGFTFVCLCFAAYFAAKDAWRDFLYYFWHYNTSIYVGAMTWAERLQAAAAFFIRPKFRAPSVCMALCLAFSAVRVFFLRKSPDRNQKFFAWFLFSWFCFSFGATALGGRNYGHYYIQPLAPAAILGGIALERLYRLAASSGRLVPAAAKTAVVLFLSLVPVAALVSPARLRAEWNKPPSVFAPAGFYIRDHSSPGDTIFVWGFAPELYLLSERRPASRFSQTNFVSGNIPGIARPHAGLAVPGALERTAAELAENRPVFIADTSPGNLSGYGKFPMEDYPPLRDFLAENYVPGRTFPNKKGAPMVRLLRLRGSEEDPGGPPAP